MKKPIITLIILLISNLTFACSCEWSGNFLRVAKYSGLIVKAKVIEHIYHTENGKRFTDQDEFIKEQIDNEFDPYYGTGESIKIEILEVIKGTVKRKIVEIFGTDDADCRESVRGFKKGNIYIMSIYKPNRTQYKLPNETKDDFAIDACSENWLEFIPETNQVFGMIKGKSYRRKNRKWDYEKLKKKITKAQQWL
jgi:hypothetical protein